jgi:hypothetical protein
MTLTARDRGIVCAVYRQRLLRRDQIAEVFFPASPEARERVLVSSCNARLQRLFQHGYLTRWIRTAYHGSTMATYGLDRRGAELVAEILGVDRSEIRWSPKERHSTHYFREHTLAVNDLWVALEVAGRDREDLAVADWAMDGPELWDSVRDPSRGEKLPVRPDAYFAVAFGSRQAHFFAEVDRSTMTNRRFAQKIRAYRLYWKSGGFAERYGASSFRVLVTAPTARRLENLRQTAAREGARKMFLFAVHADIREQGILERIWVPATDGGPTALTP